MHQLDQLEFVHQLAPPAGGILLYVLDLSCVSPKVAEVAAADPVAAAEVAAKEVASRRASAAGWLHSMPTTQTGWLKKMDSRAMERKAEEAAAVEMAARSAPPASVDQGGYYDGAYYSSYESAPAPEGKGSAASSSLSGRRRHPPEKRYHL